MTFVARGSGMASAGETSFLVNHGTGGPYDDYRSVLVVMTNSTQTVTDIRRRFPDGAGDWTLQSSSTAQGRKWWVYDKICGPSESTGYIVWVSPAVVFNNWASLVDFSTGGDAVRAIGYGDGATAATLTLPSLTAVRGDDLHAWTWSEDSDAQQLRANAPLTTTGGPTQGIWHGEYGRQVWQSSSATGTRSFTMTSAGVFDKASGVIVLVGDYDPQPPGGWGVGQVRMGAS